MKARPRLRQAAMWVCTLVAVVVVAWTICSRWWTLDAAVRRTQHTAIFDAGRGVLTFGWIHAPGFQPTHWQVQHVPGWYWAWANTPTNPNAHAVAGFLHVEYPGTFESYSVTLVYPCVLAVGMAALLWRADLKARRAAREAAGLCDTCGYDRRGLEPGSPCPECGVKV